MTETTEKVKRPTLADEMPALVDGQLLQVISGQFTGSTGRYRSGQHPNAPRMIGVDFQPDSSCTVQLLKLGQRVPLERPQTLWFGKGQLTIGEK